MSLLTNEVLNVIQGNSSDVFRLSVKKFVMDNTWSCKAIIKKEFGENALLNKSFQFDETDKMFKGVISPAETATLPVGEYILVFVFENQVQLFKKEIQYRLRVNQSASL